MEDQWCVIVIRNMPCTEHVLDQPPRDVIEEYPIAVYGPMSKAEAMARVDRFNRFGPDEDRPEYRPVTNAPACLKQEEWDEHWARACPMNDVPW